MYVRRSRSFAVLLDRGRLRAFATAPPYPDTVRSFSGSNDQVGPTPAKLR
jgi:hypothetical protein